IVRGGADRVPEQGLRPRARRPRPDRSEDAHARAEGKARGAEGSLPHRDGQGEPGWRCRRNHAGRSADRARRHDVADVADVSRDEMDLVMAGQSMALAKQSLETLEIRESIIGGRAADDQRRAEVANLVKKFHELAKKKDFAACEKVAMQAKQLDPDDPAIMAL